MSATAIRGLSGRVSLPAGLVRALARRQEPTHLCAQGFSRRQFLRAAAAAPGLMLATGMWSRAAGDNCDPNPLPHVIDLPDPLPDIHILLPGIPGFHPVDADPSTISDFNGHLGYAVIDGTGIRTDRATGAQTVKRVRGRSAIHEGRVRLARRAALSWRLRFDMTGRVGRPGGPWHADPRLQPGDRAERPLLDYGY